MTLSNGDKIMLVEVPEDAKDFRLSSKNNWIGFSYNHDVMPGCYQPGLIDIPVNNYTLLGTYHKGEIDFEHALCYTEDFLPTLKSMATSPDKKYVVLLIKK